MCACGKTVNGLRVTLAQKVNGYWDHGAKNVFNLEIWEKAKHDSKGWYQRIECWEANHWFHVAAGRTKLQSNKQILRSALKHMRIPKDNAIVSLQWLCDNEVIETIGEKENES